MASAPPLFAISLNRIAADGFKVAKIDTRATNAGAIRLYERAGFSIIWRDEKFDVALGIPLEKVHLEKCLGQGRNLGRRLMSKQNLADMIEAFDCLAAVGFTMGAEWQAVHEICQAHEGEAPFDWGHALCHRIEGDDWNADYWYRRVGKRRENGTVAEEWSAMRAELATHR